MKKSSFLFVLLIFGFTCSFSQTKSERKQAKKDRIAASYLNTKALITSGKFLFQANSAMPLGNDIANIGLSLPGGAGVFQGNRVNLTGNTNFIRLNKSKADIFLPYFGRVFVPRLSSTGNSGISFKGEIEDFKVVFNDNKNRLDIKFETHDGKESLDFHLRVNSNGNTTLTLSSSNRQTITYQGVIKSFVVKEK